MGAEEYSGPSELDKILLCAWLRMKMGQSLNSVFQEIRSKILLLLLRRSFMQLRIQEMIHTLLWPVAMGMSMSTMQQIE